jgi:hypothetical protein
MPSEHCSGEAVPGRLPILPPPVAPYFSDGLGFEPYDGGRPARPFSIHGQIVKPIQEESSEKQSSEVKNRVEIPEHTA